MNKTYLTMDVGGTNVNAGLVDGEGRILARRHFPTRTGRSQHDLTIDMVANLKELASEAPAGASPLGLAVGLPGWINYEEGVLVEAPNMPGWVNVPVVKIFSEALNMPVRLENDSNMYALGEWSRGAGRGLHNLLVITLGTGVGGGLILNDELWYGSFSSAVEIGHIPIEPENGAICGCGRRGCLETVASATGMSRLGREWLAAGRPTIYTGSPEDLNTKVLHDLALEGDQMALAVFRRAGEALGMILTGIINLLGLEGIVIGGGAARAMDFIEPRLWEILSNHVVVTRPERIKLLRCQLDEDAPLAGGAVLAGRL
ncbi:hypothetical protein C4J81_03885 [Deltaproteobacteria bacterium Smac51]|nr:hypothetical protein C4J81_03885 [Deltaproteobacteria bacterium Smac51]